MPVISLFAGYWVEVQPQSYIGDSGCPPIQTNPGYTLQQCQDGCASTLGCTAIDWSTTNGQCTYRQCLVYPPLHEILNDWQAWAVITYCKFCEYMKICVQQYLGRIHARMSFKNIIEK